MTRPWSSVVCNVLTSPSAASTATLGAGSRVSPNTILNGTSSGVASVTFKSPVRTGDPSWAGWGSRVVAAYTHRSGKALRPEIDPEPAVDGESRELEPALGVGGADLHRRRSGVPLD